jgi:outer membrane protein OmpA-like peptidoglycan-associated protein
VTRLRALLIAGAVGLFAFPLFAAWPAAAQAPSSEDIVRQLTPAPLSRSVRGVSVSPGQVPDKPSIDLYVLFEFDSSRVQNDGILVLDRLGAAVADQRLAGARFEVAGHTDSVGAKDYNQKLSEMRAKAVVDYLIRQRGIAPERLVANGYGSSRLRDPAKPTDGVNRRVQITNLDAASTTKP